MPEHFCRRVAHEALNPDRRFRMGDSVVEVGVESLISHAVKRRSQLKSMGVPSTLNLKPPPVEAVVEAMRFRPEDEEVQQWGSIALVHLCAGMGHDSSLRKQAVESGGIHTVLSAMWLHGLNGDIKQQIVYLMALISICSDCDRQHLHPTLEANILDAVEAAMHRYPCSAEVQHWACVAIVVCIGASLGHHQASESLCVGLVVAAMRRHQSCEEVQTWGAACLACACSMDTDCSESWPTRQWAAGLGALEAVTKAMQQYVRNKPLQTWCLKALSNACSTPEHDGGMRSQRAVQAGAVQAVLAAMWQHADCECAAHLGIVALIRVCSDSKALLLAREHGALLKIVAAMRRHGDSEHLQTGGMMFLVHFCSIAHDKEGFHPGSWASASGSLEVLVGAMRRYPGSEDLQKWGCGAIATMCSGSPPDALS